MATVDSLNIQITAQANSASASIDKLSKKLNTLSVSLNSINASSLSGLSNSVQRLGKSMQTLNGIKATDFTRIAKGFERFTKIDVSGLYKASGGLNTLARSLSSLSSIQNLGNITPAINAIKNLARVNMGGFDTTKLTEISSTLGTLGTSLAGVGKIDSSVTRIVSAMARLAGSGQYVGNVTTELPTISEAVVKFVTDIQRVGTVDANITKLVDGIARLASAGKKVKETTQNLKSLGDSIINLLNRLKHAPAINANIANTIQGLGSLAASGSRISTISDSAGVRTTRFGNALRALKDRLTGANKSSKGFVSTIGMFYARMFLVIRAVKAFGRAIGSAQDYIEEFNYFSVALDKIGKDSASQFKEAGYDSAEEYAKSFRTRFAKLQTQMTGYEVDYDTGEAMSKGIHNLGLDLTEVMNFNASIAQITNSAGMLGETSIMASKALSMLSADWSSLSNQDLSDVMNNMQSALIGQSRAVYKYGIDITSAGLAQTAMNHGLEVSIKDLSQQSKMQLRVLTMLEQSKVAYGDLARTINQPANQLRMLQAGFKNLARSIGNLFLPVVQKIYPYLNAIVMVLQQFVQWIAKTAGIKLGDVSGVSLPDYEEPTDGMDGYADATDKAAKKQKKLNDNLQGFDIINKLQKDESDSGDDDGDGKKNTNLDLSSDIEAALKNYEKIWNDAFKSNQNKAVQLAQKIKKALLDGWNKGGNFTELGEKLGAWINKGMRKIPWDKIKSTSNKIAKSIATFLNGFVDELDWSLLGTNIAEGLNTALGAAYTWWTTFDFLKFGTSLATMLNSALNKFDATLFGKTLGAKLRGIVQMAFGFIENFNFEQFGKKISDAVNGFFEEMGQVDERTGLTGWQEMGKTISDSVFGILTTINTALQNVKWEEVGKAISGFLTSIDWWGIFANLVKTLSTVLKSVVTTAISTIVQDPAGMIKALTGMFAVVFALKNIASGLSFLKSGITTSLSSVIGQGIGAVGGGGLSGSVSKAAKSIAGTFKASMQANIAYAMAGTGISSTILGGLSAAFSAVSAKVAAIGLTIRNALTSQAFLANFAPVSIAVAGAIVSGKLIANRINEAINAINFSGDYELKVPDKMKENAEKTVEAFKRTKEEVQKTKESIDEINASVTTTDGTKVKDLADKYFELSQKTNPTKTDIAVMKQYSEELSESIPGLSKNIDKETGAFKGNREQLNGMVSSLERAAKAQAAYNSSVELYEKKEENKKKIKEKEELLAKYEKEYEAVKKVTEAVGERDGKDSETYQAQLRTLGTYAEKVNSVRSEINLLNGSQKDIEKQIKKNNRVMENSEVSSQKYAEANKKLKNTMKNLGVTTQSQKDVIKKLNKALGDGEISWKDYKKLVDGNYDSTTDLNSSIKKLSPKSVKIEAQTKGKDDVDGLKSSIDGIPGDKTTKIGAEQKDGTVTTIETFKNMVASVTGDKTVKITASAVTDGAKQQINSLAEGKTITINPKLKKSKEFTETVKKALDGSKFKMTAAQLFPSGKQIAEYFKGVFNSKDWKNLRGLMPGGKEVKENKSTKTVKIPETADFGGVLSNPYKAMGWKVQYYKVGGFPEKGQLFRANEAGAELVGNMNGRTTVAPQNDIAAGFASAITRDLAPVMYAAFKQAAIETARENGGDVYIDGTKLTDNVIGHINTISKSRNRSPLWGVT